MQENKPSLWLEISLTIAFVVFAVFAAHALVDIKHFGPTSEVQLLQKQKACALSQGRWIELYDATGRVSGYACDVGQLLPFLESEPQVYR